MTTAAIIKYKDTISGEQVSLSVTDIKKLFCPLATDQEAMLFLELCRHQGLNPFVRDAYLLKYDEKRPATMVVGKDSFTKRAEAHPQFAGMAAGVVVQKENGEIENRKGSLILEGEKLVGGWAEVHRHDRQIPIEIPVSFKEYSTGQASWVKMPGTMIRKVALVQALREAFPSTFAGLYDSAEMGVDLPAESKVVNAPTAPPVAPEALEEIEEQFVEQPQQQPQPPQQAPVIEVDETEYGVCPMHNVAWKGSNEAVTAQFGKTMLSHYWKDISPKPYCQFSPVYYDVLSAAFEGAYGAATDDAVNNWLKNHYGNRPWSKLEWGEQLKAVAKLQEQSLAAIRPEAPQRLSVIEAEEDEDGPPDVIWEVTV